MEMQEREKKRNTMKKRMKVVIKRDTERKTMMTRGRRKKQTKRRMEFRGRM